jgi:hypothetical protein
MAIGRYLTDSQLTEIGLQRLHLPIPMTKLQIIHGAARALDSEETRATTKDELLRWIATRNLESEVLEALCILFLINYTGLISQAELKRAITRPSILSDYFISAAYSATPLIRTWERCHSLEAPRFFNLDTVEGDLSKAYIVPPILLNTLRKLEERTGLPFMRQWAYEFDQLQSTRASNAEGYLEYFSGDLLRGEGTGQFVTTRGHLARSAYLRVFSLAVNLWDMPEDEALNNAMYTTPADFSLLKMLPCNPPSWGSSSQGLADDSYGACMEAVKSLIVRCQEETGNILIHYNGSLYRGNLLKVDLEIITSNCCSDEDVTQDAFDMHDFLPGRVFVDRRVDHSFHVPPWPKEKVFPARNDLIRPCLLPAVTRHFGYLHSEMILRMPYLPVSHNDQGFIEVFPRIGGADIHYMGQSVGELQYWNDQWQPMRFKELGPQSAVSVTLKIDAVSKMFSEAKFTTLRFWRVKVFSRDREYGEWTKSMHLGRLEFDASPIV